MQGVAEGPGAEAVQRGHGVGPQEAHQPPGEAAEHPDASELPPGHQGELMLDAPVPGRVVAVEVFHTPGLFAAAQPRVLLAAFPGDARVGEAQLPVRLPGHLHLPVVTALDEALPADHVQCSVEPRGSLRDVLPGVCVGR